MLNMQDVNAEWWYNRGRRDGFEDKPDLFHRAEDIPLHWSDAMIEATAAAYRRGYEQGADVRMFGAMAMQL